MKEIPLSAAYRCKNSGRFVARVDDEDYEYLSAFNWMANVHIDTGGTVYVRARRTDRSSEKTCSIDMHRVVWERMNREVPFGMTVDHIDHGSFGALDNRRTNLRLASRKDQQGNRRKNSTTQARYKGVGLERTTKKWYALIVIDKKSKRLGTFSSQEEAARAYDAAASSYFGEFAKLNFPPVAA